MNAQSLLRIIDQISYWVGKAFAWLIVAATLVVSVEVFKRYILNAPTAWIFDLNNMLYGTLFMMCGAYTLALAGHVRADFVYIYSQAAQPGGARPGFILLFFVPGILALIYAGYGYAAESWHIGEHSTVTADGPPIYHFKSVIPVAGALVMLQGWPRSCAASFASAPAPGRRGWKMWKKSTSSKLSSRTANLSTKSRAWRP